MSPIPNGNNVGGAGGVNGGVLACLPAAATAPATATTKAPTTATTVTTTTTNSTPKAKEVQQQQQKPLMNGGVAETVATVSASATTKATTINMMTTTTMTTTTTTSTSSMATSSSSSPASASSVTTLSPATALTAASSIKAPTKTTNESAVSSDGGASAGVAGIATSSSDKDNKKASELCKNNSTTGSSSSSSGNKEKLEMYMLKSASCSTSSDKKANIKTPNGGSKQDAVSSSGNGNGNRNSVPQIASTATASAATTVTKTATTMAKPVANKLPAATTTTTTTTATTTTTNAVTNAISRSNLQQIKSENNGTASATNEITTIGNVKSNGMQQMPKQQATSQSQQQPQKQSQQIMPPATTMTTSSNPSQRQAMSSSSSGSSNQNATVAANKQLQQQQQQKLEFVASSNKTTTTTTATSIKTTAAVAQTRPPTPIPPPAATTKATAATASCDNINAKSINKNNNKNSTIITNHNNNNNSKNNNNNNSNNNNMNSNNNNNNNNNSSTETDNNKAKQNKQNGGKMQITVGASAALPIAKESSSMTAVKTTTAAAVPTAPTTTNSNASIKHEKVEIKTEHTFGSSSKITHVNASSRTNATAPTKQPKHLDIEKDTTSCTSSSSSTSSSASTAAAESDADSYANDNLILAKRRPVLLSLVNPHIMCNLCQGYLIDATTIVECLHSFCHSCLIKHLRTENYCPRCEMMINTAKPNIKPDTTLQAIVYKLVPGLYERELMRKRAFYKDRPEEAALATPEQRGDDTEHLIFSPSDYMSLSLEYADLDQLQKSCQDYGELLRPRYLQCPAMYTVGHLKKFVYGKFEIDNQRFNIDIMYKVKTIVLLDHYTLMDVAYIYTWKRDAPMRFYFRVKESLRPRKPVRKLMLRLKSETESEQLPASKSKTPLLQPDEIKMETAEDQHKDARFEIVANSLAFGKRDVLSTTDPLKITIVNKNSKDTKHAQQLEVKPSTPSNKSTTANKERKDANANITPPERKVENIKLKIDLSKQNSVTIINMSDPERKQIVKSVRPEKEWKVKSKRQDKEANNGSPKTNGERKTKSPPLPLTVPPLTIKAGRISPLTKANSLEALKSPNASEDIKKSDFLKSFALEPIRSKSNSPEKNGKQASPNTSPTSKDKKTSPTTFAMPHPVTMQLKAFSSSIDEKLLMKPPTGVAPKAITSSKRKNKDPVKSMHKKAKLSPPLPPTFGSAATPNDSFKIKLPNVPAANNGSAPSSKSVADKPHMPPPPPPSASSAAVNAMRPPRILLPKKQKQQHNKYISAPGSLTPHPMHGGIQVSTPGNRTPIANRFQPILPKAARSNPFANLPGDVNKILKDAGTEIKSIPSESNNTNKVYGPKHEGQKNSNSMGPPTTPANSNPGNQLATQSASPNNSTKSNLPANNSMQRSQLNSSSSLAKQSNNAANANNSSNSNSSNSSSKPNNYLNLALFNASKSKGNEVPPGCRTPMYSPNSPIYSPSSPQYAPNYTIPTMPTYKYTPKPSNANNYLQNVLGSASSQMASLFPSPPTRKDGSAANGNNSNNTGNSNSNAAKSGENNQTSAAAAHKRLYPFARSPSPIEDPPEKQLKVKSLLNSCNINIPSSLSITITREDSESQSNNSSKHKSPVNNYIEILKLPEQPLEQESTKRASPPMQQKAMPTTPAPSAGSHLSAMRKDISELKPIPSPQHLIARISQAMAQSNNRPPPSPSPSAAPTVKQINSNGSGGNGSQKPAAPMGMLGNKTHNSSASNAALSQLQLQQPATQTAQHKSPQANGMAKPPQQQQLSNKTPNTLSLSGLDKKTPSPEKRSPQTSPLASSENKSPKSPDGGAQSAKKFRHILPRQNTNSISEVVLPKVATGNIVGTYSSPSGIAVKVHSNAKKATPPPAKKSPNGSMAAAAAQAQAQAAKQQQQQISNGSANAAQQSQSSPNLNAKSVNSPKTSPLSQSSNLNQNHSKSAMAAKTSSPAASPLAAVPPAMSSPNSLNKLMPHSALVAAAASANLNGANPMLANHLAAPPHPMQLMGALPNMPAHLGGAGIAANPSAAELNKFLKDNLLRAQVQAAAANQPNVFNYAYAANAAAAAAQMNQFAPSMYNYQQALLREQFSRFQRAGSEAFSEYMQKLKSGMDVNAAASVAALSGGGGGAKANSDANDVGQKPQHTVSLSAASPKQQQQSAKTASPNSATKAK